MRIGSGTGLATVGFPTNCGAKRPIRDLRFMELSWQEVWKATAGRSECRIQRLGTGRNEELSAAARAAGSGLHCYVLTNVIVLTQVGAELQGAGGSFSPVFLDSHGNLGRRRRFFNDADPVRKRRAGALFFWPHRHNGFQTPTPQAELPLWPNDGKRGSCLG